MPSFNFHSDFNDYRLTFAKYVELSHKTIPAALDHQAQHLSFDLYKLTLKYTPGKDFIMAIPERVGWRIKRPHGYAVFNITESTGKHKRAYREKTRVKKDGTIVTRLVAVKHKPNLIKPGEMEERVRGVGVTARSWLPRNGTVNWHLPKVRNTLGRVEVENGEDTYSISIINGSMGMPGMDQRFGIVNQALRARAADMEVYIERKLEEAAQESGMKG